MLRAFLRWLIPEKKVIMGQMISSTTDRQTGKDEKILYSAYSEYEYMHQDQKLFIRFVCTFGLERIPEGHEYKEVSKQRVREWNQDGLVPWVGEIYFLNYASEKISVKPLKLTMMGDSLAFQNSYDLSPREFKTTEPLILLHSNFGAEFEIELALEYEGQRIELKGIAERKTVDEINKKYSGGE